MNRADSFRIAIRTFGPFETAMAREWDSFRGEPGCELTLDAVSMDHHPLYEALFEQRGLADGDWDIALINTDWLAEANQTQSLLDLTPYI